MKSQRFFLHFFAAAFASVIVFQTATANNVNITNVTNPSAQNLSFEITWDNSWFVTTGPSNYDAVWIFIKYQSVAVGSTNCASNQVWSHGNIAGAGHTTTFGQIDLVGDSKGVFLRRSAASTGTFTATVTLTTTIPAPPAGFAWNYKVFGIEMVFIPSAAFEISDGISPCSWTPISIAAATTQPTGGCLNTAISNANYPNGYTSFYSMKYEISQQQYTDFLNTLTYNQQTTRTISGVPPNTAPGVNGVCAMESSCGTRNGIRLITQGTANTIPAVYGNNLNAGNPPNSADDAQTVAMNHLSWDDLLAYLDWAALRPMTNLEYEKIARGALARLSNEYIWGTTNLTSATGPTNPGLATETSTVSGNGLCNVNGAIGPMRTGFAATGVTNREESGSAYYGVFDLGGNLFEQVVGGANVNGAHYTLTASNLGNGTLTAAGEQDVTNWQATSSSTWYWPFEMRGGSFSSATGQVRTSDRSNNSSGQQFGCNGCGNNSTANTSRSQSTGGRGVR